MPEDWIGKNLIQADVRKKYNITVVAIRRGEETFINPRPDQVMNAEDTLIILGEAGDIKEVTKQLD